MTGFEWIAISAGLTAILGGIIGFVTFVRNLNVDRELAKEILNTKIDQNFKELNEKTEKETRSLHEKIDAGLKRIEDRFSNDLSNLRTEIMNSYVNTKVCEIVHRNSDSSIIRIEENIAKLFDKFEILSKQIVDILSKKQ